MEELHTFVVMAYGDSEHIEACIRSLKAQTCKSEILMTTSTPSEFLTAVAQKYDISLKINEQSSGIATDWQFAVNACSTPYFTLAHQDDVYYEGYTQSLLPMMESSIISFCNYEELVGRVLRRGTKMLKIKRLLLWPFVFKKSIKWRFMKKLVLRFGSPVCCPAVMYNRKLSDGPIFDASYKNNLDWDAWLRFADMKGGFSYSRDVLMAHRIHDGSETTKQIEGGGRAHEDLMIFRRMWPNCIAKKLAKFYAKSYDSNSNM